MRDRVNSITLKWPTVHFRDNPSGVVFYAAVIFTLGYKRSLFVLLRLITICHRDFVKLDKVVFLEQGCFDFLIKAEMSLVDGYEEGRESAEEDKRSGRPQTSRTTKTSKKFLWCSPPGGATAYQLLHHSINRQVADMVTKNDANLALSPTFALNRHYNRKNTLGLEVVRDLPPLFSFPSSTRGLAARWLFKVPPCREGTIHLQTPMSSPGFEPSPNGTAVSVANHYTGWATNEQEKQSVTYTLALQRGPKA
ncbi:hypothetical protein TNCV_2040411 [Trichonephila clavipes]|nr:hypothetical protein TNCV_2040411 [Trichonephila clavipes]